MSPILKPDGNTIVIIVNNENPIADMSIGKTKITYLRKIKKRWPKFKKTVLPVDRKGTCPAQVTFYTKVLKMAPQDVNRYFVERQYQKAEKPPIEFNSDADVVAYVKANPGAIGYVSKSASTKGVKIVLTVE
tara:strand:- start:1077 stop:1472 length:396 start_codon:yes stop_codon:yes gene_type:complete